MKRCIACFVVLLVFQMIFPYWWWVILVPFFFNIFFSKSAWGSLRTGITCGGLLWFAASIFLILTDGRVIAGRIAQTMRLSSSWILVIITTLVAMITAGLASLTGYYTRTVVFRDRIKQKKSI